MQKKFSYRLLKWSLLLATASTLAAACKVSTGDGPDISFAGQPSDDTAGQSSGATSSGGTSSAGTANGGKSGGGTGGSGGTTAAGAGGSAAGSSAYVPGMCEQDDTDMPPSSVTHPSCAEAANGNGGACLKCLAANSECCGLWQDCYREDPTSACGWGATEDDPGQFDCIVKCVVTNGASTTDNTANFEMCAKDCLNQCKEKDGGLIRQDTNDLLDCANRHCIAECFPAE